MKKYEKGEIVEIILSVLLVVGVIAVAVAAPNAVQLFKYLKPRNTAERTRVKKSVLRLEQRGFIKRKSGTEDVFVLTTEGEKKALRYKLETMKIARQEKWDCKWRVVMFDVPEDKKQARRAMNLALKKLGCIQYQKSVFVTPFPCKKEIDFVGECFGTRQHIRLILAEGIEGENVFKKTFKL